jgi:hypothetical protein
MGIFFLNIGLVSNFFNALLVELKNIRLLLTNTNSGDVVAIKARAIEYKYILPWVKDLSNMYLHLSTLRHYLRDRHIFFSL